MGYFLQLEYTHLPQWEYPLSSPPLTLTQEEILMLKVMLSHLAKDTQSPPHP